MVRHQFNFLLSEILVLVLFREFGNSVIMRKILPILKIYCRNPKECKKKAINIYSKTQMER